MKSKPRDITTWINIKKSGIITLIREKYNKYVFCCQLCRDKSPPEKGFFNGNLAAVMAFSPGFFYYIMILMYKKGFRHKQTSQIHTYSQQITIISAKNM